jgi:4-amino-4-deoxy-L-arabinose transferase-like glycosyltransferase
MPGLADQNHPQGKTGSAPIGSGQTPSPQGSSPQRSSAQRSWSHSLLVIVLTALLLRLAVITIGHTYRITPRRDHFQFGWEMGRLARAIATGQGFSSPTDLPTGPSAWAPPLYPYILAADFRLLGVYSPASAWAILAFNSLFASLTCITIYKIGCRIYGASVARASAWIWALLPYAIYWPTRVVWETSLSAFLLSLALLLTLRLGEQRARPGAWISLGLLWGILALTNTAVLSMLPISMIWLLSPRSGEARRIRSQYLGVALCLLTTCLLASTWVIRNYEVFGKFIFIRDNLALEMHQANNDQSQGLWTRTEHPGNDPQAMQRFHELGEISYMQEKHEQVQQFIHENPGRFARFTAARAWYFWAAPPQATIVNGYDLRVARHAQFLLAALFAFAGLWLTIRNRKPGWFLLACFLLVYPLPYYLVNPFVRYKHAIEPEMVLLIVYLFAEANRIKLHNFPLRARR